MQLEYKGLKSTRLQGAIAMVLLSTGGYSFGDVTAQEWLTFLQWVFGTYALSEVGAKSAVAYKEKT